MNISIIGSGNMANGIGTRIVAGKHNLTIYDRDAQKAKALAEKLGRTVTHAPLSGTLSGDIIIFALPYGAISEVIAAHAKDFEGKIVVDISNPVDFKTFELIPPAGSSAAEEIAKLLPNSKIIKAFNTTFAGALESGMTDGKTTVVRIAGDDVDAKKALSKIITDGGLEVVDEGSLDYARDLEKTAQTNIKKMFAKK